MTVKEIEEVIEMLKNQGNSEEDIAASFYLMFAEKKIDLNQLRALLAVLGYDLSDEFLKLSEEEQRKMFLNKHE